MAPQYGLFAATYGIAGVHFSNAHTQVVVLGEGESADHMKRAAVEGFALNKAVIALESSKAVAPNLPPALAETIPNMPRPRSGESIAVLCSGFTCLPPIADPEELRTTLRSQLQKAA
jgi:uncharacterized protein YyaL (SSP411 family)